MIAFMIILDKMMLDKFVKIRTQEGWEYFEIILG